MTDETRAQGPGSEVSLTATTYTESDTHGSLIAADAAPWFNELAWRQALERAIESSRAFSVDELQAEHDLPDTGNALGGLLMRMHRAGVIERVGYRPSSRSSRAGGVVAIWRKAVPA